MKARKLISICLLSGVAALAQTAPPSQKVAPDKAAKATPAPTTAKPMAAPAKPVATPAAKPMTPQAKPVASPMKPKTMPAKPAAKTVTKAAVKAPMKASMPNKRDPFVSPIREGGPVGGPDCSVGKKCLAIDTIQLRGIVRAPSGSIAVVESSTRKVTYFLRESDPVFNGYVVKITADSVMFRENVMDRTGRQSTRDITKRVNAPPV
jgi:hypothetical protein